MGMLDKSPEDLNVKENLILSAVVATVFVGVPMAIVGGVAWWEIRQEDKRLKALENRTKK